MKSSTVDLDTRLASLIRQLVQIRFGELTSEEAKGKAWDRMAGGRGFFSLSKQGF